MKKVSEDMKALRKMLRKAPASLTLDGNELAQLQAACALAISWHRDRNKPRSEFTRKEVAKYEALNLKLSAIGDYAYPYANSDLMAPDIGDEKLMKVNALAANRARRRALKMNEIDGAANKLARAS